MWDRTSIGKKIYLKPKMNDNLIIEISQNFNETIGQNCGMLKRFQFVNGIGYVTMRNDNFNDVGTIYSVIELNEDFISQIEFKIYVKKLFWDSTDWTGI